MTKSIKIEGVKLELPTGQSSVSVDLTLLNDIELHGCYIFPQDTIWGDMATIQVVHPTTGVISEYSNNTYLSPKTDKIELLINIYDDFSNIQAGLILRFKYAAVDTNGRKCIIWYRTRQ